jgi:tRNA(Ile)-lysidine synthase
LEVLLPKTCRSLLIACSGGGDSVALALLTSEAAPALELTVTLVHCDHGLRRNSAAEAGFVRELGERLELPVICRRLEIPESGNLEAAARNARYAALAEIAAETGAGSLLTGHTAEDRAETLWLWLLRGTGPAGLAPLPASRPLQPNSEILLLRPMLDLRRDALRELLREHKLDWLEDPSNRNLDLRRNRIRHRLLPFLAEEFDLDPTAGAARLAKSMNELASYLDAELAKQGLDPRATRHPRATLAALPPALAAHFAQRALGGKGGVEELLALLQRRDSGARLDLPGHRRARLEADHLVLEPVDRDAEPTPSIPEVALPPEGRPLPLEGPSSELLELSEGWRLRIRRLTQRPDPPASSMSAHFDVEALSPPLRLVNPTPGLRIRLLGGPGARKLSALFVDRKVPRPYRATWPLLLDAEDRVLWAPGLGRSELAALTPRTRSSLCLDLEPISA